MIQIPHKYTLAAVHEQQRQITEECYQQHLESLRDRACAAGKEYRAYKYS